MSIVVQNTLSEVYPATAESVPLARRWATRFAERAGAHPETVEAVRLAVSEAATNVVLHAYHDTRETPGTLQMTAAVADDELWVLVADDGEGHQSVPTHPGLGWGLAVIANACEKFLITERSGGGTELRMRFRLV